MTVSCVRLYSNQCELKSYEQVSLTNSWQRIAMEGPITLYNFRGKLPQQGPACWSANLGEVRPDGSRSDLWLPGYICWTFLPIKGAQR
ncbi:unnamed protein product [Clavelina lepadiformis]|uniref:Uncharacterized protein n=1 Tax=Clavelina lepadiformis TaxID=159417 RepID=A0ABP0G8D1_CLALP